MQGEAGSGPLVLTIDIDTPPEFETDLVGAIFTAPPGGNAPLGTTNTLNTGDTLVSTVGDATLNFTAVNNFAREPRVCRWREHDRHRHGQHPELDRRH